MKDVETYMVEDFAAVRGPTILHVFAISERFVLFGVAGTEITKGKGLSLIPSWLSYRTTKAVFSYMKQTADHLHQRVSTLLCEYLG